MAPTFYRRSFRRAGENSLLAARVVVACRRGKVLQKVLICTPIRRGLPFARAKGSKTRSGIPRGPNAPERPLGKPKDGFPKRGLNGACRVSATHFYRPPRWSAEGRTTTPVPSSEEGNHGAGGQILFSLPLLSLANRSPTSPALRCPKKSSRCSLARFFRPLRMLRLAASVTGSARLRIPLTATGK